MNNAFRYWPEDLTGKGHFGELDGEEWIMLFNCLRIGFSGGIY
jgi:hypothetical protein